MAASDLTAEQARQRVSYDPDTGRFTSLVGGGKFRPGRLTGAPTRCGYIRVRVAGAYYKAHRLAWLMMTGRWPVAIDHINGDGCDNRWSNLREVSVAVNNENLREPRSDNAVGLLGVSKNRAGRYTSTIRVELAGHRLQLYLGAYDSPEDAHAVYVAAKRRLHDGCTI